MVSRFFAVILGVFFTLSSGLMFPSVALADSSGLGISNGQLSACPESPNCVVSQNGDSKHAIEPITYHVERDRAFSVLLKVIPAVPRTEIVEQTDDYVRAISKSRIFKFKDDVEFYLPNNEKVIHIRSASRVGESDLGVNRRRMEQIRLALQDLNI